MSAFLLGGEPGTDPVIGGFDSSGRLHEVDGMSTGPQGQAVVVLGAIVEVHPCPEPSAATEVLATGMHRYEAAQSMGQVALAS